MGCLSRVEDGTDRAGVKPGKPETQVNQLIGSSGISAPTSLWIIATSFSRKRWCAGRSFESAWSIG
jgi:hypothetical protein